jgi:hypothetical protein
MLSLLCFCIFQTTIRTKKKLAEILAIYRFRALKHFETISKFQLFQKAHCPNSPSTELHHNHLLRGRISMLETLKATKIYDGISYRNSPCPVLCMMVGFSSLFSTFKRTSDRPGRKPTFSLIVSAIFKFLTSF